MKIYFKSGNGKIRCIAKIDGRKNHKVVADEITETIQHFCDEHKYRIYYMRVWDEECNGRQITKFDVGSRTEFFYTDPSTFNYFGKVNSEFVNIINSNS